TPGPTRPVGAMSPLGHGVYCRGGGRVRRSRILMLRRLATVTAMVVTLGTSYLAGSASATVDPTHPLPVPAAPSVSVSGEAAHLSWTGVDSAAVTGYRAQIAVGAPGVVTTTPHW